MRILSDDDIKLLIEKMNYICEEERNIKGTDFRKVVAYTSFLRDKSTELVEIDKGLSLEDVMYSYYYWFCMYKEIYYKKYGKDEGIEQQAFKLLESISLKLQSDIDWKIIEQIENGSMEI